MWGPPTTWARTSGLRATKAAARRGSTPRAGARRATMVAVAKTASGGRRLQDVDRGANRQPGERVAGEGEERPVGAGRVRPGDVREGGVGRHRGRPPEVGIDAVQYAQPSVVDVAVDVVGEQRRQAGEGDEQDDDRTPDRAAGRAAAPRASDAEVGGEARPTSARRRLPARGSAIRSRLLRPRRPLPTPAVGRRRGHRRRLLPGARSVGVGVVTAVHFRSTRPSFFAGAEEAAGFAAHRDPLPLERAAEAVKWP